MVVRFWVSRRPRQTLPSARLTAPVQCEGSVNTAFWLQAAVIVALAALGCEDQATGGLKGQANSSITLFARVVDENGKGLEGVRLKYDLERIPKGWTFENRGRDHDHVSLAAVSGPDGYFELECDGHILRLTEIEKAGYQHYYDLLFPASEGVNNIGFHLNSYGDPWYRSSPANRTICVMVSRGAKTVRVLPSRGGADSGNGKVWFENGPKAPLKPSIPGITLEVPGDN